jgi:hypothetical protein
MKKKVIYFCENIKTGETRYLLNRCKGWRVLKTVDYHFTESGTC